MYADYYALLQKRMIYLQNTLQQFKSRCLALINKNFEDFEYNSGDLCI